MSKLKAISKTIWITILVVIIIVAALGAYWWYISQPTTTPTPPPEKSINIAWTEGPEFDFIESKISEFESQTGIQVNFLKIPREHIIERLMLEMMSPTPSIDGTVLYVLEAPTLAATGGLVNLYDYKPKSQWISDGFYEEQLNMLEFNGKLYFVPSLWNGALVLFYRTDLFANETLKNAFKAQYGYNLTVPETPDELLDVAHFFSDQGYVGIHLQLTTAEMGAGAYCLYPPLAYYFGGGIYNDTTGEILCNSTGSVEALEYLLNLTKYAQPTYLEDGTFEAERAVMEGESGGRELAMADQWSYMYPMLPDATKPWNITMRPFPQQPDMLGIVILKNSPKKDYVWEFVNWTSSYEIDKGTTLACPKAPCRSDVTNDPEVKSNYWVDVILDSYGRKLPLTPVIKNPHATEIYEAMMRHLHEAFLGQKTAKQALDALYEDIASILQH
ncbi:MAG: ABC transporter substrate-binding protein [Candidatus Baldrarchaeia archaeon]